MKITQYIGDSERLYSHDEICPGAPDCVHKDEDEDEEATLIDALRLIDTAYRLAEKSTPANLRRAILNARKFLS